MHCFNMTLDTRLFLSTKLTAWFRAREPDGFRIVYHTMMRGQIAFSLGTILASFNIAVIPHKAFAMNGRKVTFEMTFAFGPIGASMLLTDMPHLALAMDSYDMALEVCFVFAPEVAAILLTLKTLSSTDVVAVRNRLTHG